MDTEITTKLIDAWRGVNAATTARIANKFVPGINFTGSSKKGIYQAFRQKSYGATYDEPGFIRAMNTIACVETNHRRTVDIVVGTFRFTKPEKRNG